MATALPTYPAGAAPGSEQPHRAARRGKAGFMLAAGVLVLLAHGVDIIQAGGTNWPAFGVRFAWGTLLVLEALALRTGHRELIRFMSALGAFGTALLYLVLLQVTGRSASPLFSFSYVLVIILPLALVEMHGVALASAGLLLLGTWAMLWGDGTTPPDLLGWIHVGLVAFAVGWLLATAFRRMHRARQRAMLQLQDAAEANARLVTDLRAAIANVRTLSGLLPICAHCKRIRNDGGYWEQLEGYIAEHSQAQFSHGLCPECLRTHYPEESRGLLAE